MPRLQFLHNLVGASERITPIQLAAVILLGRSGDLRNQLHWCCSSSGGCCLGVYFGFGVSVPEVMLDRFRGWGCGVVEMWTGLVDGLDGSNNLERFDVSEFGSGLGGREGVFG